MCSDKIVVINLTQYTINTSGKINIMPNKEKHLFIQGGITDSQIGIIAPYRAQVLLLRNAQKDADFCVEVNTVDQYQGRDKNIILYSCTQSDKTKVKVSIFKYLSNVK